MWSPKLELGLKSSTSPLFQSQHLLLARLCVLEPRGDSQKNLFVLPCPSIN